MKNNDGRDLMLRRKVSRELFMKFMYQNMVLKNSWDNINDKLNDFIGMIEEDAVETYMFYGGSELEPTDSYRDKVLDSTYLIDISRAIEEHLADIDDSINKYARNWTVSTLPILDVSLMRVAIAEILYLNDIPEYASCSEAVEIAKRYCDDDSYKYINGILGSITSK